MFIRSISHFRSVNRPLVKLMSKSRAEQFFIYHLLSVKSHESSSHCNLIGLTRADTFSNLNKRVNQSYELSTLFNTIHPLLNELTPAQLEVIYDKIISIMDQSKNEPKRWAYRDFKESIQVSPVFKSLIARPTYQLKEELSNRCLLNIFDLFSRLALSPDLKAISYINRVLFDRTRDRALSSLEMARLMELFTNYTKSAFWPKEIYDRFDKLFQNRMESAILNADDDSEVLIKFLTVLLVHRNNEELTKQLVTKLISPYRDLNLEQAIHILKDLKKFTNLNTKNFELFASLTIDFSELIDKCNAVVVKHLASEQAKTTALLYCSSLHHYSDKYKVRFTNLYDSKIISLLTPILLEDSKCHSLGIAILTKNINNYRIFNEQLLEHAYKSMCEDAQFLTDHGISFYSILAGFDLPYVDQAHLTELIFDHNIDQVYKMIRMNFISGLRLVSDFCLNDAENRRLLNCIEFLNEKVLTLKQEDIIAIPNAMVRRFFVGKIYFSLFSTLEVDLRRQILEKFDQFILKIMPIKQKVMTRIKQVNDDKIAEDVRHSNGLYITSLAVYDRSIQDLISLENFKNFYNRIDQIPLNEHQELLSFVSTIPYKGTSYDHKPINRFNNKLKRVMQTLNIKPIEIDNDEFKNETGPKGKFLIQAALDSYK